MQPATPALGWLSIVRLGLVQTALGAIVILAISTLNRIMVVEYALPATVPGALVALHYAVQMLRPRLGHGSDVGRRRTRWIVGGLLVLALGGVGAAFSTSLLGTHRGLGLGCAIASYVAIGLGVGAAGTSLLVLLAKQVAPERRAAAATVLWIMMIAGFGITSGIAGHFLDPYSPERLILVVASAATIAFLVAGLAVSGIESADGDDAKTVSCGSPAPFKRALAEVWHEPRTRRFTWFVFVSMLAYSAQELVLEPYAGVVFGFTPGASARLSGALHGGAVLGMVLVAVASSGFGFGTPRRWVTAGCVASAIALMIVGFAGLAGSGATIVPAVFLLGVANGAFAVAAIGSMMELSGLARDGREGVRMGLWGGAQAVAFALGGLAGTATVDLTRQWFSTSASAYVCVFALQALLFLAAAAISRAVETGEAVRARARFRHPWRPATAHPYRGEGT